MSPAAASPAGSSPLQRGRPLRSGGSVQPGSPLLPGATGPAAGPPAAQPPAAQPPAAQPPPAKPPAARPPAGQRSGFAAGPLWMRAIPPAATLAVMLWGIQGSSYWRDEAATLAAVRRPFGDLVSMLGNVDAVHGAYY